MMFRLWRWHFSFNRATWRLRRVPPQALRDYDVTDEGCEKMRRRFEWVEDDWVDIPRKSTAASRQRVESG